ncbi:Plug domain-containing protein, partial [Caulobacter sp. 17J65-9]|uniref:TonB-dependent receptor n=1 Tax=Caulobacter sp. 17J65-9 TaxID=2709382 RepID=UPI0013CB8C33
MDYAAAPPAAEAVETVVVRAPRPTPNPGDAAFSIIRLDAADLTLAPRVDEALKQVPGVSLFRRTDSGGANATIQGLSLRALGPTGAGRALVTLDGVPQNDPFGGWVIWASLPPESLAGASVVRGAGAGPYGAGALTGVVTLDEVSGQPGAYTFDAEAGELGAARAAGVLQAPLGSGALMLAGVGERADGWIP